MALSNAQVQAAYRMRHLKDESGTAARLDVLIDHSAKIALKRLATHYRVSNRAMLETLITAAQNSLIDTLDADQQGAYYDSTRKITG